MKTFILALVLAISGTAYAHETGKAHKHPKEAPKLTAEQRKGMAEAHEKMAACLRTDRPEQECHEEMMKTCEATCGDSCPMKHHGPGHGKGHGKGHGHGDQGEAKPAET